MNKGRYVEVQEDKPGTDGLVMIMNQHFGVETERDLNIYIGNV